MVHYGAICYVVYLLNITFFAALQVLYYPPEKSRHLPIFGKRIKILKRAGYQLCTFKKTSFTG